MSCRRHWRAYQSASSACSDGARVVSADVSMAARELRFASVRAKHFKEAATRLLATKAYESRRTFG